MADARGHSHPGWTKGGAGGGNQALKPLALTSHLQEPKWGVLPPRARRMETPDGAPSPRSPPAPSSESAFLTVCATWVPPLGVRAPASARSGADGGPRPRTLLRRYLPRVLGPWRHPGSPHNPLLLLWLPCPPRPPGRPLLPAAGVLAVPRRPPPRLANPIAGGPATSRRWRWWRGDRWPRWVSCPVGPGPGTRLRSPGPGRRRERAPVSGAAAAVVAARGDE